MSKNNVLKFLLYGFTLLSCAIIVRSILATDLLYIVKGAAYLIFSTTLLLIKGYERHNLIVQIMYWASIIAIICFDVVIYLL